ncbi:adenylate/guanylate cyclase domain-containing protein [Methylocystis sp. WRRC1]|uniref:adenylate/guanylate cyclase domain-containing protein n=1 Tax=Methylocystis sp. WRRC1 TaxID=1732014 RepID=UPI001D14FAFF|nr:adenylate/guanylate cyclase domain-containing protein [Methylocystis sp. WRRC1]MCC3244340.1 adenylate/guanylate cyclase domain-containing protein [Methylocystis sp. WRRC1]
MIQLSIRRKIMGVALALIVLMALTSFLSMIYIMRVGAHFEELTRSYIPAYGSLARANISSLERALALRRMIIGKIQLGPGDDRTAANLEKFEAKGAAVEQNIASAHALIGALIEKGSTFGDATRLTRIDDRIEHAVDARRHLNDEIQRFLKQLDAKDSATLSDNLERVDALRDELNGKLDSVRSDMLALLTADAEITVQTQHEAMIVAAALTFLAALLGVLFSVLVSDGLTRPVRQLLEGTRAVEMGDLDRVIHITTRDEIGHLTAAFNRMVEQLRLKEHIRATFGKYVDPRIVEGLIDQRALASDGQRRVMTVLFCDVTGFTSASERMTPQGLVKIMNRYFSVMSEPVRRHGGVIDKYIGDAIMAYWGPPFNDAEDHARLASLAAIDMLECVGQLRAEFPELLGVRNVPIAFDIRIGVATGEVVVGSVGSDHMMSYTVLGDAVNLASRLESANKIYGSRILLSERAAAGAEDVVEIREIDRVAMLGQTQPETVFEAMGPKGGLSPRLMELQLRYAEGLAAYRAQRWDEARRALALALEAAPGDGPSMTLMRRVEDLATAPPAADWDGSWRLDQK